MVGLVAVRTQSRRLAIKQEPISPSRDVKTQDKIHSALPNSDDKGESLRHSVAAVLKAT